MRASLTLLITMLIFFGIGATAIYAETRTDWVIAPKKIASIVEDANQRYSDPSENNVDDDDSNERDVSKEKEDAIKAQIKSYRGSILSLFLKWISFSVMTCLTLSLAFLVIVIHKSRSAFAPDQFGGALNYWVSLLVGLLALQALIGFAVFGLSEAGNLVSSEAVIANAAIFISLSLLSYYAATAIGSPFKMLDSIPLSHKFR